MYIVLYDDNHFLPIKNMSQVAYDFFVHVILQSIKIRIIGN